ncbi:hypothetical protein [Alcanivorax sp.]|jgi:lysophospholipase L1-like esterase|uniref:DUF7793 family protein n=1 Tax=Alcanivorax sp. TaxID=1872427 RepID=UPI0032D95498
MSAVTVTQDGPFTLVELKKGIQVDMRVQLSIYRQRLRLFTHHQQRQQLTIYVGHIDGLDYTAARYSCGENFAQITQAKAMVLESILNRTFANMMLKLNKPAFPVYICGTIAQAKECLLKHHPQE